MKPEDIIVAIITILAYTYIVGASCYLKGFKNGVRAGYTRGRSFSRTFGGTK